MRNAGAPSDKSDRHKNASEERSRKKKVTLKSMKRRRHHEPPWSSPSSSSSGYSSPSSLSDSEGNGGSGARRKKRSSGRRKEGEKRAIRKSSRDEESSQQGRKKRKKDEESSQQGRKKRKKDEESKRQDSRSRPSRGKSRREKTCRHGRSVSVSSLSSYSSRSCSTWHDRSSSGSEDMGSERSWRSDHKVGKVKLGARTRSRVRDEGRRSRKSLHSGFRSPNCSSCSRGSHNRSGSRSRNGGRGRNRRSGRSRRRSNSSIHHSNEERSGKKNHLRHHRSPTFTKGLKETEHRYPSSKNRTKLIPDFDDFSSLRSNDSRDGGREIRCGMARSLTLQQHVLEEKSHVDAVRGIRRDGCNYKDEADGKSVGLLSSVVVTQLDGGSQCYGWDNSATPRDPVISRVKSEISGYTSTSDADDLEHLLRQKALENFRKFHGGLSSSTKSITGQKDESLQTGSCEVASAKVELARPCQREKSIVVCAKQKPSNSPEHRLEPTSVTNQPSLMATVANTIEKDNGNAVQKCSDDSKNSKSAHGSVILNSIICSKDVQCTPSELLMVHESSGKKWFEEDSVGNRPDNKKAVKLGSSNIYKVEVNKADRTTSGVSFSCHKPGIEDNSSVETKVDTKTASEFEQKTMSVMRGGEMVQVNYKVYIPKKTPALSRRQLKQ